MHPFIIRDEPGTCPICGMDLVPVPVDTAAAGGGLPGLAPVTLDAERVQAIGVRYAVAARRPLAGPVELVAFVTPDESRLRRVSLRVGIQSMLWMIVSLVVPGLVTPGQTTRQGSRTPPSYRLALPLRNGRLLVGGDFISA